MNVLLQEFMASYLKHKIMKITCKNSSCLCGFPAQKLLPRFLSFEAESLLFTIA